MDFFIEDAFESYFYCALCGRFLGTVGNAASCSLAPVAVSNISISVSVGRF